jgi:hypothetical protein
VFGQRQRVAATSAVPAVAVNGHIATFNGTTGTVIQDGGACGYGLVCSASGISASPQNLFNIATYGAVADYHEATTLSTTVGSTVTATGSPFTAGMVGSLINITGAGASGATYFGSITAFTNANSVTVSPAISTAVTNVFGQFCVDNTAAIQAAINAARTSGGTAGGGTILIPLNSTYCIQQLDFTNGPPMVLKGASTVNGSRFMPMRNTNSVMDWTGTSQVNIDGISVGQYNQLAVPTMGLVLSPSNPNSGIDHINLRNIFWTGRYLQATVYIDRAASSTMQKAAFLNYYQGPANQGFTGIFTSTNIFGFSSAFATTWVGSANVSDWSLVGSEFHSISQAGGVAAYAALYLDGSRNISFFGGNIATSHAGIITVVGTVYNTLFQGVTFYSDTGPSAVNIFTGVGNMNRTGLYFIDPGISGAIFAQSGTNTLSVVAP